MIQRIQSIYLLIASLLAGVLAPNVSLWTQESADASVFITDLLSSDQIALKGIPVLFFASALVALAAIFLFKNRQLQFVLGRVVILINLFLVGLLIYLSLTLSGETAVSEKGIGMLVPIFVILLVVLANKAIRKDEDLVKSVDRLR